LTILLAYPQIMEESWGAPAAWALIAFYGILALLSLAALAASLVRRDVPVARELEPPLR
jgi:hypothetical protein